MDKAQFDRFDQTVRGKIVANPEGQYKGECVSLVRDWLQFNGWPTRWGNAIDWRNNGFRPYKWFPNYWWSVPQIGDMVVFQVGTYGHIGIVGGATANFMDVLNQNWPHGNDTDPVQVTRFDYVHPRCIGFLRFCG
ncbi:MAG: CHAP domain-containing protein [Nitrospiria bacterium]